MYEQHPLSAAFPLMDREEFQLLLDSISDIGVQNPITLYEGKVIDGWQRYRAATELGMECPEQELEEGVDPRSFVLAQNKARRYLTQGQLAMATTAVFEWAPEGRPKLDTECPVSKTSAELAEISGVHVNTIKQAKVVQTKTAPEVVQAVKAGKIGLPKAAAIAKLPRGEQAAAMGKPIRAITGRAQSEIAPPPPATEASGTPAQPECSSAERIAALEEEIANLREALAARTEEVESLARVLDAADQLAAALEEAEKARSLARGMQARISGLMNEVAALKRSVKHLQRKAEAPA